MVLKNYIVTRQGGEEYRGLRDNFKVYGSILDYINGIMVYAKNM
jgi:hypothetical protein